MSAEEISIPSSQSCCDPKTSLKLVYFKKKKKIIYEQAVIETV